METAQFHTLKRSLRITHDRLDDDIESDVAACMADLRLVGVIYADEKDPLIFNAIKLWCKANYTDDTAKAAEYQKRYDALKACLLMAEGYGRPAEVADD